MSLLLVRTGALGRPLIWLGVFAAALAIVTLGLWAYYGTTVFFEAVRAGWAACF
ncbi:MAG TPA: hypothetical protein VHD59_12240 [Pseudolabrys sp.]|jgi:hypothetical protein|nr:hypothetical protein [Pseudolabrys sp.]